MVASLLLLAGCGEEKRARDTTAAAPVAVQAVAATEVEWPETYEATGTVRARTVAVISSQVMGYVREVKVQAGDHVRQGQPLVVIDSRDLDAQVRQAEAARNEARSAVPEVENAVAAAKANLELAEVTLRRMKDLFDKKSISSQEFDEASTRLKAAQAGHEMAKSKREQLQAKIRQAEEAVQAAGIIRSYADIAAPFDGTVTEKRADPGDLATPGAPLVTIERAGAFRLEASVAESRLPQIRSGQPVSVSLEALDKTLDARVSEIVPAVDAASRAYIVKIDLPALGQLRSGMFGRAVFRLGTRQALAVPEGAVVERGQLQSVLVADAGVARARLVTLGPAAGGRREVLSGLKAGEKVIVPVPAGLADGARVEVRP
jgi:RND family efflux transporter MFP subunit